MQPPINIDQIAVTQLIIAEEKQPSRELDLQLPRDIQLLPAFLKRDFADQPRGLWKIESRARGWSADRLWVQP
jgi:hypothetical protein